MSGRKPSARGSNPVSRQNKVVIAVLLLLGMALSVYLAKHLSWEKVSRRGNPSGEALHNPYHAGLELMRHLGYPAERLRDARRLSTLPHASTLLLAEPEAFADKAHREELLAWVRKGGHLVLPLTASLADSTLLEDLGIQTLGPLQSTRASLPLDVEGKRLEVDADDALVFDLDAEAIWQASLDGWLLDDSQEEGDDDNEAQHFATEAPEGIEDPEPTDTANVYARFALGEGYVTAGYFPPFRTQHIDRLDHARLFVRLMSLAEEKRPVFMILAPEYPSLISWLLQRAPEALLGLVLLAAASLWRLVPRFGPMRPEPVPSRPGLREHLAASGSFLLRHHGYESLIAPLREDVIHLLTHLRNRHPELDSLAALGSRFSALPETEVERALASTPGSHQEFMRHCQTLAALRSHCHRMRQADAVSGKPS